MTNKICLTWQETRKHDRRHCKNITSPCAYWKSVSWTIRQMVELQNLLNCIDPLHSCHFCNLKFTNSSQITKQMYHNSFINTLFVPYNSQLGNKLRYCDVMFPCRTSCHERKVVSERCCFWDTCRMEFERNQCEGTKNQPQEIVWCSSSRKNYKSPL